MRFMPHRCKPRPVDVYHYEPASPEGLTKALGIPGCPSLPVTAILMRCGRCGRIETEVHAGTWSMYQLRGWQALGATDDPGEGDHPELEPFDELPDCLADALVTASRSGLPAADVVDQLRRRIADELTVHWPGFDLGPWMRKSFPSGKLPGESAPYTETGPPPSVADLLPPPVPPLPADAGRTRYTASRGSNLFSTSPAGTTKPGKGPREVIILRDLSKTDYPGLNGDLTTGTKMWTYFGPTYGCLGPDEVALTREKDGQEFEAVPTAAMAILTAPGDVPEDDGE